VPLAVVAEREADIRQALAVGKDFGISVVIVGGARAGARPVRSQADT